MIKRILEKQVVFDSTLKVLAFLGRWAELSLMIKWLTNMLAHLNVKLNKPQPAREVDQLADRWKAMMPTDGQHFFKLTGKDHNTAYAEIHLHCPLRNSGDVHACYKLMNYDRQLMKKVGGQLVVLQSQSNSGKEYCKVAIRRFEDDISDLTPAHKIPQ